MQPQSLEIVNTERYPPSFPIIERATSIVFRNRKFYEHFHEIKSIISSCGNLPIESCAWIGNNSEGQTHPVASLAPYDLNGTSDLRLAWKRLGVCSQRLETEWLGDDESDSRGPFVVIV